MTNYEIAAIEDENVIGEILNKPKRDWSSDDLNHFNEWFWKNPNGYKTGVAHLMQTRQVFVRGNRLTRYALSFQDAEDIVQTWWMNFQIDATFDSKNGSFHTYYRCGINLIALSQQRKSSREVTLSDLLAGEKYKSEMNLLDYLVLCSKTQNNISDPDEVLRQKEIKEKVIEWLEKLRVKHGENYSRAVTLRYLEELEYEQIAEILKVTYVNARVLVSRGLRYLAIIAIEEGF